MGSQRTSLDHLETNHQAVDRTEVVLPQADLRPYLSQTLCDPNRSKILDALKLTDASDNAVHRFATCGTHAWVFANVTDPDNLQVRSDACRSRWCPVCSARRGSEIAGNMRKIVAGKDTRLMTLTLKHSTSSLKDQLDRLYRCFLRLRRSRDWSQRVRGGIQVLEIKLARDGASYHPHLHVIVDGEYYPHQLLSHQWWSITGDSKIVDVRRIDSTTDAVKYLTKYLSKPADQQLIDRPDRLAEVITQTKGRRFVFAFGTLKISLTRKPPDDSQWMPIAPLSELIDRARKGDEFAVTLLDRLRERRLKGTINEECNKCQQSTIPP